jgi:transcriptional regulator with XRE-family HTH domain
MQSAFGPELGRVISTLRQKKSFSQAELAEAAGITPVALSRLENGKVKNPHQSTIVELSKKLEFSIGLVEELRAGAQADEILDKHFALFQNNQNLANRGSFAELLSKFKTVDALLSNSHSLTTEDLKVLADRFGIEDSEDFDTDEIHKFFKLKADEYRALKSGVDQIDAGLKRLSNLKAAAQDAIANVNLDEVETLLARVQEVELDEAAKTAELRAANALLRGKTDQAHALLSAAAGSFAAVDPLEPAKRRLQYEDMLYAHGLRYGGNGMALAIEMIRTALANLSERTEPLLWAHAQNNLGNALQTQGSRTSGADGNALLADAVTAYRSALRITTETEHPVNWAATQNNLGNALEAQGTRTSGADGNALLADAVTAYRSALRIRTETAHPVGWAATQNNLSLALQTQGTRTSGADGNALLADAVTAYRSALRIYTETEHPVDWAMTQNNLSLALQTQGTRTSGADGNALLADAVTAYRSALRIRTETEHPVEWAMTQENLAIAEQALAHHDNTANPRPHLIAAMAHVDSALTVYDPVHMPYNYDKASGLRDRILADLANLDPA